MKETKLSNKTLEDLGLTIDDIYLGKLLEYPASNLFGQPVGEPTVSQLVPFIKTGENKFKQLYSTILTPGESLTYYGYLEDFETSIVIEQEKLKYVLNRFDISRKIETADDIYYAIKDIEKMNKEPRR